MKLIKGCLVIVLVLCAIIVFADGKRKKGKVLEKPYTGEARLKPGEPSVDFCFFGYSREIRVIKRFKGEVCVYRRVGDLVRAL